MFTEFYCDANRDSGYVYVLRACMKVCCSFYIYYTGINAPDML